LRKYYPNEWKDICRGTKKIRYWYNR
jgi:hypothetical protein